LKLAYSFSAVGQAAKPKLEQPLLAPVVLPKGRGDAFVTAPAFPQVGLWRPRRRGIVERQLPAARRPRRRLT
jgi:hypothetical protein